MTRARLVIDTFDSTKAAFACVLYYYDIVIRLDGCHNSLYYIYKIEVFGS